MENSSKQIHESKYCKFCSKQISEKDQKDGNYVQLQSTGCNHIVHCICLTNAAVFQQSQCKKTYCPQCYKEIHDYEINIYLTEEQQREVDFKSQEHLIKINPKLVRCKCGNIWESEEGEIQNDLKDNRGQPLSEEFKKHFAINRLRCPSCEINFCKICKQDPYHVGKNCYDKSSDECRFCQKQIKNPSNNQKPAFQNVCQDADCVKLCSKFCDKVLGCSHPCNGFVNEQWCLPCLEKECIDLMEDHQKLKVNKDDYCPICYSQSLAQEPNLLLECGHIMHLSCLQEQLEKKWDGPRIVFNYLNCPECKQLIQCKYSPEINAILSKELDFKKKLEELALERANIENFQNEPRLQIQGDIFYNDLKGFALAKLSFYQCFECKLPYFGGMKECDGQNQQNGQQFKQEDLVCGKCIIQKSALQGLLGQTNCPTHGADYIEFKCKFCCTVALWFCWGSTHFCEPCHRVAGNNKNGVCLGAACPLKVQHPPNGQEFALGCGMCRQQYNH